MKLTLLLASILVISSCGICNNNNSRNNNARVNQCNQQMQALGCSYIYPIPLNRRLHPNELHGPYCWQDYNQCLNNRI